MPGNQVSTRVIEGGYRLSGIAKNVQEGNSVREKIFEKPVTRSLIFLWLAVFRRHTHDAWAMSLFFQSKVSFSK